MSIRLFDIGEWVWINENDALNTKTLALIVETQGGNMYLLKEFEGGKKRRTHECNLTARDMIKKEDNT